MSFSLPYWRKRRYLKGIDWMLGVLDYGARKSPGFGALSQVILQVKGTLAAEPLAAALKQISDRFPLIHGRPSRDWMNLAPYWKFPRVSPQSGIALRVVEVAEGEDCQAHRLLEDHINSRFESDVEHLRFLLIHVGQSQSYLGMVFDHRMLDAFGAETFFRLIEQTWRGNLEETAKLIRVPEPAHLDHWKRRFDSGKTLNKRLYQLAEQEVCAMKMPEGGGRLRSYFLHESLSQEQSVAITQRAARESGVPILLPTVAARAILAMRKIIPSTPLPGTHYLACTSANTRATGQEWDTFFFNHISFLLLSAKLDMPQTAPELAIIMRDQFFSQMKERLPFLLQDAADLFRICPLWLSNKFMGKVFGGRMCSLYLACLRETGFPSETFMGLPTINMFHKPLAFSPPGMNLCMTFFGNRFNLVLSYLEGAIDESLARGIMQEFKSSLLG